MSFELQRRPARFDSQMTRVQAQVEVEDEFGQVQEKDVNPEEAAELLESRASHWNASADRLPRFSVDHSQSHHYDPYTTSSRRASRIPNLKGASPHPGSYLDTGYDHYGETPWKCGDPRMFRAPVKGDSWHRCHRLVEKYDNDMCDAWKEEVDKLLIFAGLFSATVTAFLVESYKWLDPEPEDLSVQVLAHISAQLANSTMSTLPAVDMKPFRVAFSDVLINTAWFLSLTLSLTTVLIGILCLQWLREFQRDPALPHKDAVALRQMRYEGLLQWRVPEILSTLPILLQTSLILFFIGLLDLLWCRNAVVAGCVSALVTLVMIFIGITTALPALQHFFASDIHLRSFQCPYKSPQSWIFYRFCQGCFHVYDSIFNVSWSTMDSPRVHRLLKSFGDLNWTQFDMRWRQLRDAQEVYRGTAKKPKDSDDIIRGLHWVNDTFAQSVEAVHPIHQALRDVDISAAAGVLSQLYADIGQIDSDTLRVMLDDRFSPTEDQKRDIISAFYLHLHQEQHPMLRAPYIENVIRILNSQEVPQPFYDWLSEVLQDLATASYSQDIGHSLPLLSPDINIQILLCVKSLMARNVLRTLDMVVTWALLNRLLSLPSVTDDRPLENRADFYNLRLACGMFEAFEQWIGQGKELQRWERVKLCAEGMMTIFPPSVDLVQLAELCPDMSKGVSLVRMLDVHFDSLGGPANLLARRPWWLHYWEVFTEDDWKRTKVRFEGIAEDV